MKNILKTGVLIKQLREKYGITLQKLEELSGVKYTQIIHYEKGRAEPKNETIFNIIKNGFNLSETQTSDLIYEFKIFALKKLLSEKKQIEIFGEN